MGIAFQDFFFFSLFLIVHTYILYPVIIKSISLLFKVPFIEKSPDNSVSILISVFNEEKVIKERINNIASLDYDFNNIEVIVGSDCSVDKTNSILKELSIQHKWLKVHYFTERRGKASVLNDLAEVANNDFLVFTDANSVFSRNALCQLMSMFHANDVGGVCGRLILSEPNSMAKGNEEKKYWDYETFIKKAEGRCGVLIVANGGIFAIRKSLFKKIPTHHAVTDDLFISLSILKQNKKFLFSNQAVASEDVALQISDEFRRKTRFSATNFQTLPYYFDILFNKNILLSFAFWSHKIIRWITPILLLLIFILNFFIYNNSPVFTWFLYLQIGFYIFSLIGYIFSKYNLSSNIFSLPFYFTLSNIAIFIGMIKFIFKKHTAYWNSTPR